MNSHRKRSTMFVILVMLVAIASPALAKKGARYTITDLGVLPGKSATVVWGFACPNNAGRVVGYCNNGDLVTGVWGDSFSGNVAFIWSKQQGIQALPLLTGYANASAYSLNERGQAVGRAGNSFPNDHAVLWENGIAQELVGLPGMNETIAWMINDRGQVAGQSDLWVQDPVSLAWSSVICYPVMWDESGVTALPLPTPYGGNALAINARGQISGQVATMPSADFSHIAAAIWERGGVTVLNALGGEIASAAAISENGLMAGRASTPDGTLHACIWRDRVPVNVGSLGGSWISLWSINNSGEAVGEAGLADGSAVHAIYSDGGPVVDLNNLIPTGSDWTLASAIGINELGQISGFGIHNGEIRSYVLTPAK